MAISAAALSAKDENELVRASRERLILRKLIGYSAPYETLPKLLQPSYLTTL